MKPNYYIIRYSDPDFDRDCMMVVQMTESEYNDLMRKLKFIDAYDNGVFVRGTNGNIYVPYACGHDFVERVTVTRISGKQYTVLTQLGYTAVGIPNNIEFEINSIYDEL